MTCGRVGPVWFGLLVDVPRLIDGFSVVVIPLGDHLNPPAVVVLFATDPPRLLPDDDKADENADDDVLDPAPLLSDIDLPPVTPDAAALTFPLPSTLPFLPPSPNILLFNRSISHAVAVSLPLARAAFSRTSLDKGVFVRRFPAEWALGVRGLA